MLTVSKINMHLANNNSMALKNQSPQSKLYSQPMTDTVTFGRFIPKSQAAAVCADIKYVNEIFTNILSKEYGQSRSALDGYTRSYEQGIAKKALAELLGCSEKDISRKLNKIITLDDQLSIIEGLQNKGVNLSDFQAV